MAAVLPAIYLCDTSAIVSTFADAAIGRVALTKRYTKWLFKCACCSRPISHAAFWAFWTLLCEEHLHYMIKQMYPIPCRTVLFSKHELSTNKVNP